MNSKELEILGILDNNSRITTKELGKKIRSSQQSANYLLHKIIAEPYFKSFNVLIDSARFGLIKVIVFYNYTNFKSRKKIVDYLHNVDSTTLIEECSQGFDLMAEFTVQNLSYFNKINREILQKFKNSIRQMEVYPLIVKHIYSRNYLNSKIIEKDIILAGDRDLIELTSNEKLFLKLIQQNAREPIISISSKMKCDSKTVIQIKKKLEKKKVIKKYCVSINTPSMSVFRIHILANLELENVNDMEKFHEFLKMNENVIKVQKIIGNYELLITIEKTDQYQKVFNKIREEFLIEDYKIIISDNIVKELEIPDFILCE